MNIGNTVLDSAFDEFDVDDLALLEHVRAHGAIAYGSSYGAGLPDLALVQPVELRPTSSEEERIDRIREKTRRNKIERERQERERERARLRAQRRARRERRERERMAPPPAPEPPPPPPPLPPHTIMVSLPLQPSASMPMHFKTAGDAFHHVRMRTATPLTRTDILARMRKYWPTS
jgi:hypothetical protein